MANKKDSDLRLEHQKQEEQEEREQQAARGQQPGRGAAQVVVSSPLADKGPEQRLERQAQVDAQDRQEQAEQEPALMQAKLDSEDSAGRRLAAADINSNPLAKIVIDEVKKELAKQGPAILSALLNLVGGLFKRKAPQSPPTPTPDGHNTTRLPDDDNIPNPTQPAPVAVKVVRVRARIQKIQHSAKLHPDAYTDDNPLGLYQGDLTQYETGASAIGREAKVWFDLSAFTLDGAGREVEMGGDELKAAGLAFRTTHTIRDTRTDKLSQLIGRGSVAGDPGTPAEYTVEESNGFGFGDTSWRNSLGCNAQTKAWGESEYTYEGGIGGVTSNMLTPRVS